MISFVCDVCKTNLKDNSVSVEFRNAKTGKYKHYDLCGKCSKNIEKFRKSFEKISTKSNVEKKLKS